MKRILVGINEIAGNYQALRDGFVELGFRADHLRLWPYKFDSASPEFDPTLVRFHRRLQSIQNTSTPYRVFNSALLFVIRLVLLFWVFLTYDVIILSGSGAFFRFWELPFLRLVGKTVIVQFHGSDARPPYMAAHILRDPDAYTGLQLAEMTAEKVKKLRRIEQYANIVVAGST